MGAVALEFESSLLPSSVPPALSRPPPGRAQSYFVTLAIILPPLLDHLSLFLPPLTFPQHPIPTTWPAVVYGKPLTCTASHWRVQQTTDVELRNAAGPPRPPAALLCSRKGHSGSARHLRPGRGACRLPRHHPGNRAAPSHPPAFPGALPPCPSCAPSFTPIPSPSSSAISSSSASARPLNGCISTLPHNTCTSIVLLRWVDELEESQQWCYGIGFICSTTIPEVPAFPHLALRCRICGGHVCTACDAHTTGTAP